MLQAMPLFHCNLSLTALFLTRFFSSADFSQAEVYINIFVHAIKWTLSCCVFQGGVTGGRQGITASQLSAALAAAAGASTGGGFDPGVSVDLLFYCNFIHHS